MTPSFRQALPIALGGIFLFLDRFLKWQSLHEWAGQKLFHKFLGWYPSYNTGVAFGLPLHNSVIIIITFPIIILVVYLLLKNYGKLWCNAALSLALFGALSNFYDRLFHQAALDYFLVFTLIFNIADVMIVIGLLSYFIYDSKCKKGCAGL